MARRPERAHEWAYAWGHWQCLVCAAIAQDGSRRRFKAEECPGQARHLRELLDDPKGHNLLVAAVHGQTIVACAGCGGWAAVRARSTLNSQCTHSKGRARTYVLKRIEKGLHPDNRVKAKLDFVVKLSDCIAAAI